MLQRTWSRNPHRLCMHVSQEKCRVKGTQGFPDVAEGFSTALLVSQLQSSEYRNYPSSQVHCARMLGLKGLRKLPK